jgi:hypothetical protein
VQAIDSKILGERLSELSEVFQAKPVSEKGVTVWFNVLREFPTEKVCDILNAWPRSHSKMPTPNEVWKAVNEICIALREKKAEQERKAEPFHPGVGGARAAEFLQKMRETLNKPDWTPLEHWKKTYKTQKPGSIGYEYAKEVLIKKGIFDKDPLAPAERVPGEDDEQKAVNF